MPPPLPTTRQLLTSLINAITHIPLHHDESLAIKTDHNDSSSDENTKQRRRLKSRRLLHLEQQREDGTNVLKRVPTTHRHLIITLHVLFPGLVLPALDLLDRGLVGRIILRREVKLEDGDVRMKAVGDDNKRERNTPEVLVKREDDESMGESSTAVENNKNEEEDHDMRKSLPSPATFYLVRSAQASSHHWARRRRGHGSGAEEEDVNGNNLFPGGQRGYIVRLDAWNCTCAAFAFAAFPVDGDGEGSGVGIDSSVGVEKDSMDVDLDTHPDIYDISTRQDDGEQWNFGGMSLENNGSASAPLCKHLLACLLAERWGSALGQYVVERHVSKEEMAGIVAEI